MFKNKIFNLNKAATTCLLLSLILFVILFSFPFFCSDIATKQIKFVDSRFLNIIFLKTAVDDYNYAKNNNGNLRYSSFSALTTENKKTPGIHTAYDAELVSQTLVSQDWTNIAIFVTLLVVFFKIVNSRKTKEIANIIYEYVRGAKNK